MNIKVIAGVVIVALAAIVARAESAPSTSIMGASPRFVALAGCDTATTPFCNALMTPPPAWPGRVFHLSQAYPLSATPEPHYPWSGINPKSEPNRYAYAVLKYFYEGNIHGGGTIENDFDPARNLVRRWYNAPFQDLGVYGREFVHGLTEERNSPPGELTPSQTSVWANYAVGFYNAPGGAVIRQVWSSWRAGGKPDIAAAALVPDGTVAAKLLFTTASPTEVPFIAGAPAWDAYVYANVHAYPKSASDPRVFRKVRLLQIDFAVKDRHAGPTGWFFGTFVYGGGPKYTGPPLAPGWTNVAPVGLMWGNDPDAAPSPAPTSLKETWLNPNVTMMHYGYQGRLNGPVDNPQSSCMSCHSSGEMSIAHPGVDLGSGMIAPIPPATPGPHPIAYWFRNVGPAEPFDGPGYVSTGYSLQVMDGLNNFYKYIGLVPGSSAQLRAAKIDRALEGEVLALPPRDGGR